MKTRTIKKISIFFIAVLIISLVSFLVIYFNDYNNTKKIEKLKLSNIEYIGRNDKGDFVYMGNDAKIYTFSEYTSMQDFSYETVNARKDGLEGVISKNNKVLVPFGKYYDILDDRVCGSYIVQNEEGKYGLISYDGKVILDTIYDKITNYGASVPVFKIQYQDKYFAETIFGNILYDTTNPNFEIIFGDKLNVNSDRGLVKIIDNDTEMIFDVASGKMITSGKNLSTAYNIVKDSDNNRFLLIDGNGREKLKVDYIAGEESLDLKFDKYVVIESKAGYYEIYNKSFEKAFETERKPAFFKNYKGDTYIINNVENGVQVYKDFKLYASINGYEYALDNMVEYGSMFTLKDVETGRTDLFDFELNLLKENVLLDKIYPKYVCIVNSESEKVAYTVNGEEVKLGKDISLHALNTNSTFNDYILVSKADDIYDMIDLKGNYVIRNISKLEVLLDNNILVTDKVKGDMYLFNVDTNKKIFEFSSDKYDSSYEKVQVIKLKSGYVNYNGEQIAKIDE